MEAQTATNNQQSRWERFISVFESTATKNAYASSLRKFFRFVYGEDEFTKLGLEGASDRYFTEDRNYEEDVREFFAKIKEHPPKSVFTWLGALKSFLIENDVELPQKFWRAIRRKKKGSRALTQDIVPSNKQLRMILSHMRVKGKALFLMMASSGMRIGEALQLKLEDVDFNFPVKGKTVTKINIRGEYTKTGNQRIAFISKEATEMLKNWLGIRDTALKTAIGRSRGLKPEEEDDRIFPYHVSNIYAVWHGACDKAKLNGIDTNTHRRKIHPHVLRKFFRSKLATEIEVDIVEALMGHEAFLSDVYRRYPKEKLAEKYLKGEHTLSVFTDVEQVSKLRQEVKDGLEEEEKRGDELQKLVNGLTTENLAMGKRLKKLENDFKLIESVIGETKSIIEHAKFLSDDEKMLEARIALKREGAEICLECGGDRGHDEYCSRSKKGKYANKKPRLLCYYIPPWDRDSRAKIKELLKKKKL